MGIFLATVAVCGAVVIAALTVVVAAIVGMMIRDIWKDVNERIN